MQIAQVNMFKGEENTRILSMMGLLLLHCSVSRLWVGLVFVQAALVKDLPHWKGFFIRFLPCSKTWLCYLSGVSVYIQYIYVFQLWVYLLAIINHPLAGHRLLESQPVQQEPAKTKTLYGHPECSQSTDTCCDYYQWLL